MTGHHPAPLTAPECDLRDFPFMPVDIARLFNSEFHARASDGEWRAAVTLWLKSYHQVPAGSVPDDDIALARLAEFGRDLKGWRKVREVALHGWLLCADGRLYHPVVAEKANEAWERKKAFRDRTEKARQARLQQRQSQTPQSSVTDHPTDPVTTTTGTGTGTEDRDRGQGQPRGESAAKPRALRKCPPTFEVTTELRTWAAEKAPHVDWVLETEKFRDHTFGNAITDWPGAWRNWLRRAQDSAPRNPHPNRAAPAPSRQQQREQTIAGLTGSTPERTDHAARQPGAIDVESRRVD